jgi:secretion/DNA translocation related TadE-like protein
MSWSAAASRVGALASRSRSPACGVWVAAGGGAQAAGRQGWPGRWAGSLRWLGAGLARCSGPACAAGSMTGSLVHHRASVRDRRRPAAGAGGCESGSVTVVALALGVVVVMAGLVAFDVGLLAAARARAQTAADLAALAALTATGEPAVASAAAVARANGAELHECACTAAEAVVTVHQRVLLPPAGLPVALRARARAVLPAPPSSTGPGPPSRVLARRTSSKVFQSGSRRRPGPSARTSDERDPGCPVPLALCQGRHRVGAGRPRRAAPLQAGAAGDARGGAERHTTSSIRLSGLLTERPITKCSQA